MIKTGINLLVGSSLVGATLENIGANMTGSVKGIGNATQALVAGGFLGHAAGKMKKWL